MELFKRLVLAALLFTSTCGFAMENVFYMLRDDDALPNLQKNYRQIHVLIAQAYKIDEYGRLSGYMNANTKEFADDHHMKLMALVTNVGFNRARVDHFLSSPRAQRRAINTLLQQCVKNNYYGVQFDFEGVPQKDREALTRFYTLATESLRQYNFKVSFAVVAIADGPANSSLQQRQFNLWSGAYDYAKLAELGEFVSIMAYDQHSQGTTPGPTASLRWVDSAIKYALRFIPREKLSLGIPVYSGYWYTGNVNGKVKIRLQEMTFAEIKALVAKHNIKMNWDNANKYFYSYYEHDWLNTYLFAEDVHSFKAKLRLAQKYRLRGVSVFNLGSEDDRIWRVLASVPAPPKSLNRVA